MSTTDTYAFGNLNEVGPEVEPDCPVPVDVWAKVLDLTTGEPTGYVKRKRFRTYREVFRDLHRELDRIECPKCGWSDYREEGVYCKPCPECREETECFIDEHFSLHLFPRDEADRPIKPHKQIVCYAVTGGSEGHWVHVEFEREGEPNECWAIGKTFRGWDHAWEMAKRCAELLGV